MTRLTRFTSTAAFASIVMMAALGPKPARAGDAAFRPPSVPLVTYNHYLSIWSPADHLNDTSTVHWTHREHALVSLIRIDGKAYRLMGKEPIDTPPFPQVSLQVLPTRTIYDFDDAHVHVKMTFMTAALPTDLEVFSRPLSYITWQVSSVDGAAHDVSLYDSTSSELAVNKVDEKVEWARETAGDLTALRVGTHDQPILGSSGDDHRIDWGYAYAAASTAQAKAAIGANKALESGFVDNGALPAEDDTRMPRAVNDDQPVLAFSFDLGKVAADPVQRQVIVAYDEIYAIKYYGKNLRPYWRRNGATAADVIQAAAHDYPDLARRCEDFDKELMADMTKEGGPRYAQVAALAYRQCLCACGFAADAHKQPLLFTKENTSNGDIATVDVFFPMDPLEIFFSPTLAKASLVHCLIYAASSHWKFPNAPHDLGTYPIVTGRDDGGEAMAVEESGNMIILCDAICQEDGNTDFVSHWWPQLTGWAKYLEQFGLDPELQLCTDDFKGRLAHNSNLSVKAIVALAAYGDMCKIHGDAENAKRYYDLAKTDADHWVKVADDGGHYRLAFDKPNTWSQKYNLVWDRILGLNVFPPEVARKEVAFYKTVLQPYGLPLDSRDKLTKTDWSFWSATLAELQADFETIVSPIYDYLNKTTARSPLVDSYWTDNYHSDGMHARPVVGGIFIKMLTDRDMWKKWSSRDHNIVGGWANIPAPPVMTEVVPSGQHNDMVKWRYTLDKPADGWTKPDFDDSGWKEGLAPIGTNPPNFNPRTRWTTDDIWIRRTITLPQGDHPNLKWYVYHDEDVNLYVNGIPAGSEGGYVSNYVPIDITPAARALLQPGATVTVAAHVLQTTGGQGIDIGLADVTDTDPQ